jgi:hypothetical protein
LAACIACGLAIRAMIAPFGPAFARLASGRGDDNTDAVISSSLARARPFVMMIWAALLAAGALGIATPLS